ncbi:uncharacterized protein B0P05DRAFT_543296 [Gilbertella persicaria]|uniref:uncharacterized protein n=1 Tax=Gilbertella persicaria TaxID=101096 RepID=UPI00221EFDD3|nr:uncharacterized protein B0P05DRAFT_543296 [Gilbertella persicaria]KAI8077913.1 hypothetical protein B0P05DRAFT_543296 [Gilbertella persicaria]
MIVIYAHFRNTIVDLLCPRIVPFLKLLIFTPIINALIFWYFCFSVFFVSLLVMYLNIVSLTLCVLSRIIYHAHTQNGCYRRLKAIKMEAARFSCGASKSKFFAKNCIKKNLFSLATVTKAVDSCFLSLWM